MTNLAVFSFDGRNVRFVDGKPVANDVAAILGYANPAKTVSTKVDPENKGVTKMVTPGGIQLVVVLEEAGIYQLIFASKLAEAKRFQQWVFSEVLPSIRKTGGYHVWEHNIEWFERLKVYRRHTKIPTGWFSIFETLCSTLMADMEDAGYVLPMGSIPDISVGKCFCLYLREVGYDTANPALIRKYEHHYPDGRVVWANIYADELLPSYRRWFAETYRPYRFRDYIKGKDPGALPTVNRLLGLPEGAV